MRRGKNATAPKPATTEGGDTATETKQPPPPQPQQQPPAEKADTAAAANPYENSIKAITTVHTVEEFWSTYNYLKRPNELGSGTTDYHCFREGVKPTWEDPANAKGGKWIVRLPKGLASRYWEEVVLALMGGQFVGIPEGEITGLVISIRYSEDILGIWNRNAGDPEMVDRLRDAIKKVLQLPSHAYASMEYKPHQTAMADRSSFRNAAATAQGSGGGGGGWKSAGGGRQGSITTTGGDGNLGIHAAGGTRERRSGSWGERGDFSSSKAPPPGRAWR